MSTAADPKVLIRKLWETGHFWNPQYPGGFNLRQSELDLLKPEQAIVIDAVKSYQQFEGNLPGLVRKHHNREPIFDGVIGPATIELADMRRCPIPDFAPPPNVRFNYDDPELQRAVLRYQAAKAREATGTGSWPHGCHGTPKIHDVTISYDTSGAPSNVKEWFAEIKKRSAEAVAAMGVRLIEVPVGQPANIRVSWRVLAGSTIGMAEFNNGTCGDSVFCYLDPGYAPELVMVLILLLHENGHNWNFEHSNGGIMNPSIIRVEPFWVKRDAAGLITYRDIRYPKGEQFFGGKPIDVPGPGPGPTPPPGGSKILIRSAPGGMTSAVVEVVATQDFTVKAGDVVGSVSLTPFVF